MSNIQFSTKGLGSSQNSLYEVEKFNGADYTTTPTAVDETRAIDVSNYLPEGNGLVKRNGITGVKRYVSWLQSYENIKDVFQIYKSKDEDIYVFCSDKVNGVDKFAIFVFNGSISEDGYVAEAGEGVLNSKPAISAIKKIVVFENKENIYFFTGVKYYMLKKTLHTTGSGNNVQTYYTYAYYPCQDINSLSIYMYAPLITTNIPSTDSNGKALSLEQPNLLTTKVRIGLSFTSSISAFTAVIEDYGGYATSTKYYKLTDYLPSKTMPGNSNSPTNNPIYYINDKITYPDAANAFTKNVSATSPYNVTYVENDRVPVQIIDDNGTRETVFLERVTKVNYGENRLEIKYRVYNLTLNAQDASEDDVKLKSILENNQNCIIQDEIEITVDGATTSNIKESDNAIFYDDKIFAFSSNSNVMYNTLNPKFPSNNDDYTYFGSDTYQLFGNNSTGIIAVGVLNNGNMIVVKESEQGKTNVYFRHKEYRSSVVEYSIGDIVYNYNKTEELYPITQAGIDLECDKETKIIQYDNKVIISAKKGIYYINVDSSTATQTYNAYELSYMIRNDLSDDLSINSMAVYNGQLWVARKNKNGNIKIYVADKDRYTFVDGKMQYEWWVLDGIDAEELFTFDDSLFFKNYYDKYLYSYAANNGFYDVKEKQLSSNSNLNIGEEYITITLDEHERRTWNKEDYQAFKNKATLYGTLNNEEANTKIDKLYYIKYQTVDNVTSEVARYEIDDCDLIDGKWYYTANNHFDYLGNLGLVDEVFFSYIVPETMLDTYAHYIFNRPIRAYWKSKYTDLGATEVLKSTNEVYFVPETRRGGAVSIGYKTAKREKDFSQRKIILARISEEERNQIELGRYSFDDVDFTDFHFETDTFAHIYSCRRKVKNFAFIQFKFYSDEPKDSTIVKFAVKYHKTRDSRGAR